MKNIIQIPTTYKCKCGKEISHLAKLGNDQCFDCLMKDDAKEDWEGLQYFLSKTIVNRKIRKSANAVKIQKIKH